MTLHAQSVRAYLSKLEAHGLLKRIAHRVDPNFEISAHLCLAGNGPALRFDRVAGSEFAVFGNLLCSRERVALGLGVARTDVQRKLVSAMRAPAPVAMIADAPCQELSIDRPELAALPIPKFFEHETGAYLTAGAIVARDPQSGKGNLSFARVKPLGANRAFIGIAPEHHLAVFARRAPSQRLPVALTLGNHPAVMIAAALYLGVGEDELCVASALFDRPLEAALTANGLAVPAHCEMVLEGEIDAAAAVEEGPVSEYHGMYETYGAGMEVQFTRITLRKDAMLQVIQPGYYPEHVWIGAEAIAASLAHRLGEQFALREVAITPGGAGRLHAVVALKEGAPREVMQAVWDTVRLIKLVTIVDADIDPWDAQQVEWALATRMRAERDLVVLSSAPTSRSDPIEQGGSVGKLGIDATRKPGDRDDWRLAQPPAEVMRRIAGR
ncbi:MAG TPA: UbiD family decarboxylase [Burkholderiales bacterium]|nr:UbiD family decarboxylase [Burkholderiales bacterium]